MNPTSPKPRRRWFQFRLRTLLVLMVLASIGLSWFAVKMQKARRQREAVAAIEAAGGLVLYAFPIDMFSGMLEIEPNGKGPQWLRKVLGEDFFTDVFWATIPNDGGIEHVKGLPGLQVLRLESTEITDAELGHLIQLPQLKTLFLDGTLVTDGGLEQIKQLSHLEELSLTDTRVTDAGLEHLKGLNQLRHLRLDRTMVTDDSARRLQQTLPKCDIHYR